MAERVDEQPECRRRLPPAWVVKVHSCISGAPVLQHALQSFLRDIRLSQVLGNIGQSQSSERRVEHLKCAVEGDLPFDPYFQFATSFFKLPGIEAAVRLQAQIDAIMADQVLGLL